MFGFEDDAPPPAPRRVSDCLREVVANLDEAIAATDNPALLELLRQVLSDAGYVWSESANLEASEDESDAPAELVEV